MALKIVVARHKTIDRALVHEQGWLEDGGFADRGQLDRRAQSDNPARADSEHGFCVGPRHKRREILDLAGDAVSGPVRTA